MSKFDPGDLRHMRHALRLADRALGSTAPNPAVGCVIVAAGRIAGRGWTQPGGRPHAETVALAQAGAAARGATAYVTLEPCAHYGKTPPCAGALAEAGVARVVAAATDPDPRVSGAGFAALESQGVVVTRDVMKSEAEAINAGFFRRVTASRPLVALKIAQTLDGRVADADGNSRWITAPESRRHAHLLRTRYDAIVAGIATVLADDPLLTCRLPGLERHSPIRVVMDSRLQLPADSQLVKTAHEHPVLAFTVAGHGRDDLAAAGVEIVRVERDSNGMPDIDAVLRELAARGLTRVLVEGGPRLHASFLKAGLCDLLHLYRAPILLGAAGVAGIGPAWHSSLISAPRLRLIERIFAGPDLVETFYFR